MTSIPHDRDDLTLQAYCDGELDAAATADFERRLVNDPELRRRRDSLVALRSRLRALPQEAMPDGLEARITSSLRTTAAPRRRWSGPWRGLAACLVIGILAGGLATHLLDLRQAGDRIAGVIVGNHIRGLLAPQPFDVASSDRHTVKPWFSTHVAESPKVADLSAQGFALVGGRVDVVGQTPVATIVYRHAAHVISVTVLPRDRAVPAVSVAGYHVTSWQDGNFTYVAVSDIPEADLAAFRQAFLTAAKQL